MNGCRARVNPGTILRSLLVGLVAALLPVPVTAQSDATQAPGSRPDRVQLSPLVAEAEVGQTVAFKVDAFDAAGARIDAKPSAWFATPFDVGAADANGVVTMFAAGELRVGAIVNGKPGFATVRIKPQTVGRIEVDTPPSLVVGSGVPLAVRTYGATGVPRSDASITWTSETPAIAAVDAAGFTTGLAPGRATLRATSDAAQATVVVQVVRNPVTRLRVEPATTRTRTGDVVRFMARVEGAGDTPPAIRWSVGGPGAAIEADGGFVAEIPGTYVVTAAVGDRAAAASVVVTARNVGRELEVVGRTPIEEFQTLEQWTVGDFVYATAAMSGKLWVYDTKNPSAPAKVDSLSFDARILNDISVTPDGKIGVLSREGASNRKNGIVFLDTTDLAHPKILSEYTETVTGGVHSAFIDGTHVYLTDDATGSMRVVNFEDPRRPKEVGRWQADSLTVDVNLPDGQSMTAGRYLHDVYVKDGLAYLAYWRDGLVILDVGAGIRKGSPVSPQLVSRLRFNYHELYGSGWLAGAHAVFRYKNYLFVADEVFPAEFDLVSRERIPVKGIVHVIDVSDLARPRKVAEYDVPEGGAHNLWVEDDVLYMGYYSAGARVVDVSGELRGNLYRQGREIARLWTGDPKGYRPNQPFTWGAQPHKGLIYFNDINSGIWITRLKRP